MSFKDLKDRNTGSQEYIMMDIEEYPKSGWEKFKQVLDRGLSLDLLKGLGITFKILKGVLVNNESHNVKYPMEKLPMGARFRAVHKLLALQESGTNRCIGCGLCEKICIANCIRMDTKIDEDSRKEVAEFTINLGRCIFCGYCAEVCPELAIVHAGRYENASEQREHFILKEDMHTPFAALQKQLEYEGFGAISPDADERIKKTPLGY